MSDDPKNRHSEWASSDEGAVDEGVVDEEEEMIPETSRGMSLKMLVSLIFFKESKEMFSDEGLSTICLRPFERINFLLSTIAYESAFWLHLNVFFLG